MLSEKSRARALDETSALYKLMLNTVVLVVIRN